MNQLGFKKEWIEDGGLCPVDIQTTMALCLEVRQAYTELDRLRAEKAEMLKTISAIYGHTVHAVDEYTCASAMAHIETICRAELAKAANETETHVHAKAETSVNS